MISTMQDNDRPKVNNHYWKGMSIIVETKAIQNYQKFLTEKSVTMKVNPAGVEHKLSTFWLKKEESPFTFRILKLEHAITMSYDDLFNLWR